MNNYRLSEANSSVKFLVTAFLVLIAIGYLLALLNIYDKTNFTATGIAEHYRGNEEELIYPIAFGDLISTSHTHLLGMTLMFMMLSTILIFTSVSETVKKWVIGVAFFAIFLDITSIWLTRYVASQFSVLLIIAGALMGLSFLLLLVIPLRDTCISSEGGKNG